MLIARNLLRLTTLVVLASGCAPVRPITTVALYEAALLGSWDLSEVDSKRVTKGLGLTFYSDGSVLGSIRCNSLSGRYQLTPKRIIFADTIVTAAGCRPDWPDNRDIVGRAEQTLFSPRATASLSNDGMLLIFQGQETLKFRRVAGFAR